MGRLNKAQCLGLSEQTKGFIAAGIVVLCWSGFNIVSRLGSKGLFTPFDLAAMRFGVSGVLSLPFFVYYQRPSAWPRYFTLSLFGGLGYGLLVYSGFSFAPSSHAGMFVNGGIPFWTVVLVSISAGYRVPRQTFIALLLSGSGLCMISFDSFFSARNAYEWVGDLLFLMAALSWAIFGLLVRRWTMKPLWVILGIASFASTLYLPVYVLWLPKAIESCTLQEIALQCIYQGIIAAMLAAGMYSYANRTIGACQASMMLALVPAASAIGAYFILDEVMGPTVMFGILVVTGGAILGVGRDSVSCQRQKTARRPK